MTRMSSVFKYLHFQFYFFVSLVNLGLKIGQPHIKQYKAEFSGIRKLSPCTMTELKKCRTFFILNVTGRVKNVISKLVQ